MNSKNRVNGINFVIASVTAVLFGLFGLYNLLGGETFAFVVFSALSLLFAYIATEEGAVVEITPSFVCLHKRGRAVTYKWDEIAEVGVVGLRLFRSSSANFNSMLRPDHFNRVHGKWYRKPADHGTKYIYFSLDPLSEQEVFDMCLKWPPKDKIFIRYTFEKVCFVQSIWDSEIRLYNADEIELP